MTKRLHAAGICDCCDAPPHPNDEPATTASNTPSEPEWRLTKNPLRIAFAGGIATAPLVVAAVGWASSWNAYTNLYLALGGLLFWGLLWGVFRD